MLFDQEGWLAFSCTFCTKCHIHTLRTDANHYDQSLQSINLTEKP